MKESGWKFQRVNLVEISIYKSGDLNGLSSVKLPSGSSAFLKAQNDEKFCFLWSIFAKLHPCENNSKRVTN